MKTVAYISALLALLISSCDIKKSNIAPEKKFMRVFDDSNFSSSYYPLDILTTEDNGYLILAAAKLDTTASLWKQSPFILRTDETGMRIWERRLELPYVDPVPGIMANSNRFSLVCMDNTTQQTHIVTFDPLNGNITDDQSLDVKYPLSVYVTENNDIVLLSFDVITRKSIISKFNDNLTLQWQTQLDIIDDIRNHIIEHLNKTGETFPFFIGEVKENGLVTTYFVNCFVNYTLSMVFTDVVNGSIKGLLNGYQDQGAVSSAIFLSNNNFALSKYSFGDNYLLPNTYVDIREISSVKDMNGNFIPELNPDAKFIVRRYFLKGRDVIVYASDTKDNQLAIYYYEAETNFLLGTKYLFDTNPIEISSILNTPDGGLLLLARTFVVGRFPRIALIKLAPDQLGF